MLAIVDRLRQCLLRFKNGARYIGSYTKGKKNGYGTFVYPDGSKYVGNWVNDEKQGFGTYHYVNGDIYEGDWYENKRHGQGMYLNEILCIQRFTLINHVP